MAKLISNNYPQVPKESIIGHCEVNKNTTCPGERFLPSLTDKGWKEKLLSLI
ncbi:MAG: hypothetical protein KGJ90_01225 [Patescibacteria group bacterium]|nr:hypothetical protein [Patescibacteria group bacterium]